MLPVHCKGDVMTYDSDSLLELKFDAHLRDSNAGLADRPVPTNKSLPRSIWLSAPGSLTSSAIKHVK